MLRSHLYHLLSINERLKTRRHPLFERNRYARIVLYIIFAYYAAMLLLLGVTLPLALKGGHVASFRMVDAYMPFLLMLDFWCRFVFQETPAMQVKVYTLLPVSRSSLLHFYLLRSLRSAINLFWGFFLVPFGMMAVVPVLGFGAFVGWLLGYWLLILANSLCYQFFRSLCLKNLLWTLLPLLLHAGVACLYFIPDTSPLSLPCILLMDGFASFHVSSYCLVLLLIIIWYGANYVLQKRIIYSDVANEDSTTVNKTHNNPRQGCHGLPIEPDKSGWERKLGIVGEYIKMEIRLHTRNRNPRINFIVGLCSMVFFALLQYFTDWYSGSFQTPFFCLFSYIILGAVTLINIMCYEGNYIDGLMARRESILSLLTAKYYFNACLLLIPFSIQVPLMMIGKQSVWMNLGFLFFTLGCLYPAVFLLAVYNDNTLQLNGRLTTQRRSYTQQVLALIVLFIPLGLERLALLTLGSPWAYVLMIAMGLAGLATHRLWLGRIYASFMARRYANMEGFRASRL